MSTLQDRIKIALLRSGLSKTDLWKGCGVSSATVTTWVNGRNNSVSGKNLVKAADILGVNAEWLATGEGSMSGSEQLLKSPTLPLEISLYNKKFAESSITALPLNEAWVKHNLKKVRHKNLTVVFMTDDSMKPTLFNGDFLLVDTSIKDIEKDGIYAFKYLNEVKVRRIQRNLDTTLLIKSDNKTYETQSVNNISNLPLELIGKAIWAWSEKKL